MADAALSKHVGEGAFVTGQIVRVDLVSGLASIINAGHPPPIRIRGGHADPIELHADPPFATPKTHGYRVQEIELRPGDRLVFLTDGMLERNAADVDVPAILAANRHLHPREAVQELTRAVVEACGGALRDDGTVLCLDWHGGPPRARETAAGADR